MSAQDLGSLQGDADSLSPTVSLASTPLSMGSTGGLSLQAVLPRPVLTFSCSPNPSASPVTPSPTFHFPAWPFV